MKAKTILLSAALAASAIAVNAKEADAATVKKANTTVTVSTGASVFDGYELANMTGRLLRPGETVTVQDTARDVSGNEWLKVSEGWIMSQWTDYDLASVSEQNTQTAQAQTAQQTEAYNVPKKTENKKVKADTPVKTQTQASLPEEKTQKTQSQSTVQSNPSTQSSASSQSVQSAQSSQNTARSSAKTSASTSNTAKEWIAQRESGGSYTARNGRYYGRYQLDSSYLKGDYSAANQEKVADNYVRNRYGSWENAKAHWLSNGWY